MKRIIVVGCIAISVIILFIFVFKNFIGGNNKTIENVDDLDKYILNIQNYRAEATVYVFSNKNSNTYNQTQECEDGKLTQEISDTTSGEGIVIINEGNKVTIKNTKLAFEKVFDMYEEAVNNQTSLDSFVKDYANDNHKEIKDENGYYIINVKSQNTRK